jgi:L-2-hydroxyglutarate oxidase LhgO
VTPGLLVEYLAGEAAKLEGVEIRCDAQVDGVEMHDGKVKSLSWSEKGSKESREVTDIVFAAG